jgi:serine/threonine-protein kinase RsbT
MSTTLEQVPIRSSADVVAVRNAVRRLAERLGFRHLDVTKLVTAASEIARNTLVYGGGGTAGIDSTDVGSRSCLRVVFEDHGPGIADIQLAFREGYTTGGGMGLGLSGSRKLVDDFHVDTEVGRGTRVTMIKCR